MTSPPSDLTPRELALLRLSLIPGIGPVVIHALREDCNDHPERLFSATADELARNPSIRPRLARMLLRPDSLVAAEQELRIIAERRAASDPITPLFYGEGGYPDYLLGCSDAPPVLYVRGQIPIDGPMIAIVGTRRCTTYAADVIDTLVEAWAKVRPDLIVVSGLAYGVDILAHRAALKYGLRTVAVVAHGHSTLYPARHRDTAREIIATGGGIVTEYPYYTKPFPKHFVLRNRIVAGMTLGTVVVESAARGGALITAGLALDYGRSVFAVPGRLYDTASEGCNALLTQLKATCLNNADTLLEELHLEPRAKTKGLPLPFTEETEGDEDPILVHLRDAGTLTLNDLTMRLGEETGVLSGRLFELELEGKIRSLPGARYELTHH